MSSRFLFAGAAGALLVLPLMAAAHETGVSYQVNQGAYTIDVGYSEPAPQAGESVQFNFLLRNVKTENDTPFSDAWVKITDTAGNTVLATGVHNNPFGGPRLSYVFPKAGTYTVDVRYETDTASIVESSFPITVLPADEAWYARPFVWGGALIAFWLVTLGALVYVWSKRRR